MMVIDFESAPATFVAEIVMVFAPAIKFELKFNCPVEGLKANIPEGIGAPFVVTEICPTEVTFCTIAFIGREETLEVNGFIAGFTIVINGGGVTFVIA